MSMPSLGGRRELNSAIAPILNSAASRSDLVTPAAELLNYPIRCFSSRIATLRMNDRPFLSIVTATTGKFSQAWLTRLLTVQGPVEFVMVYPPGVQPRATDDRRVRALISPFRGEVLQRFTGLLNATGNYTIALDDDDFIHPDICALVQQFSQLFPDDWVLRLSIQNIPRQHQSEIEAPWLPIPNLETITHTSNHQSSEQHSTAHSLRPIPIAPLQNPINWMLAIFPFAQRRDHYGRHIENFNNRVWKTDLLKVPLNDWSRVMKIYGNLYWLPSWSLDRALGLFVQAFHFNPNIRWIGYSIQGPEQVRYIVGNTNPETQVKKINYRFHFSADLLLAKRFPKYGYFWNLFFNGFYTAIKQYIKLLYAKLLSLRR
ncbi:MAG: glycosyltransferase family 2 protein [Limnothrix sp. BL-A-16]